MGVYLFPIKTAIITFPIVALIFTLPFLIYQYRKHGYINKFRSLILYSFLLYLLAAYYLIILPLPKTTDILSLQAEGTQHVQLMPFNFISEFLDETSVKLNDPSSFIHIFKERAFLQAAFNGILLTPLGIYLRYYFKKDLKKTILITFLVSLFFELTQLTGLYCIYNAPYRLFDVDDLILNTFSGFLGYLVAPIFTFFLPNSHTLDDDIDLDKLNVGYIRRYIAFFIDWFILGLIPNIDSNIFIEAGAILIYFILIVYFTNGRTIGKAFLRIKVKGENDRISFKEVFLRYGTLYYGFLGVNKVLFTVISLNEIEYANYIVIVMLLMLFIDFLILLSFLLCILKRDKTLIYEKWSNTRNVIT